MDDTGDGEVQATLLDVVDQLAHELHPQRNRLARLDLDSTLDKDFGFDSLARVELLHRLERQFRVSLSERVLAEAETPRDLLHAVQGAHSSPALGAPPKSRSLELGDVESTPRGAETLVEVLLWYVENHPDRPHVLLYEGEDEQLELSYLALYEGAREVAAGLQRYGLQREQTVAIMLPTGRDYLFSFYGILLAGGVPVPIYPPARPSQLEDHLRRHGGILANARTALLITVPQAQSVARLLMASVPDLQQVMTAGELRRAGEMFRQPVVGAEDIAFLQYTSGSTGQPKGVVLTHANLLANIRAMGMAIDVDSTDVFVSWLPLYHDMGLIGAWLGSLYYAMPLVLMSPLAFLAFLADPARWLRAIHEHGGTLSAAPNFAFELCINKLAGEQLAGLDLSRWRRAFNGAEPVSPRTIRRFRDHFAPYGFRPEAMAPVYGLAEAAVGLAFPPRDRGPLIDRIQREPFTDSGQAIPADATDEHALEYVACGQPLSGYQVRVVDAAGRELPERRQGRLQFQGPSATRCYYHNPEATALLLDGAWLETGDYAYMAGGDVHLTGRIRDMIIRAGRNFYPYELEQAVGELPGIRKGCVAVFGSTDPGSHTERVIVVAEIRETKAELLPQLREQIFGVSMDVLGMPPDDVVLAPAHSVLKTSSGKIRRSAVCELYERNGIGRGPRAVWLQLVRLTLASIGPRWRSRRQRLAANLYAGYSYFVFALLVPITWLAVALLPGRHRRWACMRGGARLLLYLAGIPLQLDGGEQLPAGQSCVIVVNHASYLDGLAMAAGLPMHYAFVVMAELSRHWIPRVFLRRIGAEFVERFDKQRGVADARHAARTAKAGRSLLFFPEGTFTRIPGLLPFHLGAFIAAAEAGVPVVPVTLSGTRSILRADSWYPRRHPIKIRVSAPIAPEGSDWAAAIRLRDAAREAMLQQSGEPDLAQETSPV